jgi:hypothetical protein
VGAGISLMIVGAILAFAVRRETPGVDVQTVGVILLVAGALVIAHARRGSRRERTVTRIEDPLAGEAAATHHVAASPEPLAPPEQLAAHEPLAAQEPQAPPRARGRRTVREQVTDREIP